MTARPHTTIRRRPDGSLDIPFYARRAREERHAAIHAMLTAGLRYLQRAVVPMDRLRAPHHSGPSHPSCI